MMATQSAAALDRIRQMLVGEVADRPIDSSAGYLDLLGGAATKRDTPAERAMNNRFVVSIYEGLWRQGLAWILSGGVTRKYELAKAAEDLYLSGPFRLLDVACGPGNFTRYLGQILDRDGLAVGLDVSVPMLTRAVRFNGTPQVGYLRADARRLPFPDRSFDALCCYAALYLVPEPFVVLDEAIRVLAPGGRIAVMTSCERGPQWFRTTLRRLFATQGVHLFSEQSITAVLREAGFTNIDQTIRGTAQFVNAIKSAA